jgi:hypothetical protein
MSMRQRRLRFELVDEIRTRDADGERDTDFVTIAEVVVEVPANMEIPGERLIEGARLAYRYATGVDLPGLSAAHVEGGDR